MTLVPGKLLISRMMPRRPRGSKKMEGSSRRRISGRMASTPAGRPGAFLLRKGEMHPVPKAFQAYPGQGFLRPAPGLVHDRPRFRGPKATSSNTVALNS